MLASRPLLVLTGTGDFWETLASSAFKHAISLSFSAFIRKASWMVLAYLGDKRENKVLTKRFDTLHLFSAISPDRQISYAEPPDQLTSPRISLWHSSESCWAPSVFSLRTKLTEKQKLWARMCNKVKATYELPVTCCFSSHIFSMTHFSLYNRLLLSSAEILKN